MKKNLILIFTLPLIGIIVGIGIEREWLNKPMPVTHSSETAIEHAAKHMDPTYVCPMHSQIVSKESGQTCPICGMDLVPVKLNEAEETDTDETDDTHPVVKVNAAVINNLGVRTAKIERTDLARRVETPGFIQQIKAGKMSYFNAPFDGVLAEVLYEPNKTYDIKNVPLVAIESDELLNAQTMHLAIYGATDKAEKTDNPDTTEQEPADDANDAMLLDSYLDADGKITGEYRDKLFQMGHNDESIAELEEEMRSMRDSFSSNSTEKADKQQTGQVKTAPATAAANSKDKLTSSSMTLDESRKKLRSLGMRDNDIFKLERSGKPSNRLIMYSSHPGRVLDMRIAKGMAISKGERLFKLGGEVRATVVANAFQRDAAWIKTGQRVEVRIPHQSGSVFPGIVNQGAVSINPDSQNIGIRLTFTAPLDKIRSNMYVVGTIFGEAREDVLAVPTQAIIRTEGEDRVVKALGDGRFKPVTVKLGVESGSQTEIIEGLNEGDEVVVMAQFLIDSESSLQASLLRLTSQ